jgi:hypothetical protein
MAFSDVMIGNEPTWIEEEELLEVVEHGNPGLLRYSSVVKQQEMC